MYEGGALHQIWRYTPLFLVALAWEATSRMGLVSAYALPPFTTVIAAWWELLHTQAYYYNVGMSLWRGAVGFAAATVSGLTLGVLMAWYKGVNLTIGPIVQLFYPMPKSALIPLTILWFGLGHMSKIFLIFLGCLLPILLNTYNGVRGTDRTLLWSSYSLGASRTAVLWDVGLRSAVPDILAGMRTALALGFVLLISSELMIANEGLGYLIRLLGDGGLYARMFAVIMTVMLLGFTADRLFLAFTRWMLRWRQ